MHHPFKNIERLLLPVLLLLVVLAGCASPPVRPQTLVPGEYGYLKEQMAWLIRNEMAKNNVQGLSIALVDGQKGSVLLILLHKPLPQAIRSIGSVLFQNCSPAPLLCSWWNRAGLSWTSRWQPTSLIFRFAPDSVMLRQSPCAVS